MPLSGHVLNNADPSVLQLFMSGLQLDRESTICGVFIVSVHKIGDPLYMAMCGA